MVARFLIFMLLIVVPIETALSYGWLDHKQTTKTRVCTKAVLSFTDWATCEREAHAAGDKEMCEMWGASCVEGCTAFSNPQFCLLQCAAKRTICFARAK